jgi:hypothetical protein
MAPAQYRRRYAFLSQSGKAGYRFVYATDATCYWRPRRNFGELFKQHFSYAKAAFLSRSSPTFVFEAYGANHIVLTIKNLSSLM